MQAEQRSPSRLAAPVWVSALAALTTLSACAASPRSADSCEQRALLADGCIAVEQLAEWEFVDERTVLLWAPEIAGGHLVHLVEPIEELVLADEIDLLDRDLDGLICPCGSDEIGVSELRAGSVRISSIEHLADEHTAGGPRVEPHEPTCTKLQYTQTAHSS